MKSENLVTKSISVQITMVLLIASEKILKLRILILNFPIPIPDEDKKLSGIFILTLLCGASKGFMKASECMGRWATGTCFGIELYWSTRMLRNFNVKVRYFPHAKKKNAIDHQSNDIISKIFKLKEFIQLKVPSCKVIISTSIRRHDNEKPSSVVDDVIQQCSS